MNNNFVQIIKSGQPDDYLIGLFISRICKTINDPYSQIQIGQFEAFLKEDDFVRPSKLRRKGGLYRATDDEVTRSQENVPEILYFLKSGYIKLLLNDPVKMKSILVLSIEFQIEDILEQISELQINFNNKITNPIQLWNKLNSSPIDHSIKQKLQTQIISQSLDIMFSGAEYIGRILGSQLITLENYPNLFKCIVESVLLQSKAKFLERDHLDILEWLKNSICGAISSGGPELKSAFSAIIAKSLNPDQIDILISYSIQNILDKDPLEKKIIEIFEVVNHQHSKEINELTNLLHETNSKSKRIQGEKQQLAEEISKKLVAYQELEEKHDNQQEQNQKLEQNIKNLNQKNSDLQKNYENQIQQVLEFNKKQTNEISNISKTLSELYQENQQLRKKLKIETVAFNIHNKVVKNSDPLPDFSRPAQPDIPRQAPHDIPKPAPPAIPGAYTMTKRQLKQLKGDKVHCQDGCFDQDPNTAVMCKCGCRMCISCFTNKIVQFESGMKIFCSQNYLDDESLTGCAKSIALAGANYCRVNGHKIEFDDVVEYHIRQHKN